MSLYRHVGIAAALSPRVEGLLAEALFHLGPVADRLSLVHAGARTRSKEKQLRAAMEAAGIPDDATIFWEEGEPADAIIGAVRREDMDMVVAGALEKERPLRYYLGSVAHNLARELPCSLILIPEPQRDPKPFRKVLVITDYSEASLIALVRAIRMAERENAESIHVARVLSEYGQAMIMTEGYRRERAREIEAESLEEEEELLRDFVDAAGASAVPIEAQCLEGKT